MSTRGIPAVAAGCAGTDHVDPARPTNPAGSDSIRGRSTTSRTAWPRLAKEHAAARATGPGCGVTVVGNSCAASTSRRSSGPLTVTAVTARTAERIARQSRCAAAVTAASRIAGQVGVGDPPAVGAAVAAITAACVTNRSVGITAVATPPEVPREQPAVVAGSSITAMRSRSNRIAAIATISSIAAEESSRPAITAALTGQAVTTAPTVTEQGGVAAVATVGTGSTVTLPAGRITPRAQDCAGGVNLEGIQAVVGVGAGCKWQCK